MLRHIVLPGAGLSPAGCLQCLTDTKRMESLHRADCKTSPIYEAGPVSAVKNPAKHVTIH